MGNYKTDRLYKIVPKPNVIIPKVNNFIISRDTIIVASEKLNPLGLYLQDFLIRECKLELKLISHEKNKYKNNFIILRLDESINEDPEAYHLNINKNKIAVVVGKGNNGGDGLTLTRYLLDYGYNVNLYMLSKDKNQPFLI